MRPRPSCRLPSIPCSPPTRDKPGAETIVTIALALALGVVIGVLLGLLGGGGSILAVPALVYALGLRVELATSISLIVIGGPGDTAHPGRLVDYWAWTGEANSDGFGLR